MTAFPLQWSHVILAYLGFFTVIFRKNTCPQANRSLVLVPYNIFMRFSFPYESIHLGFFTIFETHFNALCTCSCTISDSEMHLDKLLNKQKNNQN